MTDPVLTLSIEPAIALEEQVIARLRTVFDPEIPVNLYDLGLIYDIAFTPAARAGKSDAKIVMTLTTPNCPVAGQMPGMVEAAVKTLPELDRVAIDLVFSPPWDKSRMSDEARLQLNML